ncbi:MAG TPA: CAP domain-containing protein [Thermoleophilaceae bacterium]
MRLTPALRRFISPRAAAVLLAAPAALLLTAAPASADGCSGADAQPTSSNLAQIESTTLCLLNAERRKRGLSSLRTNARLRLAALRHSRDMVARHYFAHESLGGGDFEDRIRRAGYIPRYGAWAIGENIGWGTGILSTPGQMVNAWMNSPPHRRNILASDFREIGIALAAGNPSPDAGDGGGTYTTDFGRTSRSVDSARRATRHRSARGKRAHIRRHKSSRTSGCHATTNAAVSICP